MQWKYRHMMTIIPSNMAKHFIWIEEAGEHINEFEIGYMINPNLHVNKAFR